MPVDFVRKNVGSQTAIAVAFGSSNLEALTEVVLEEI
jgi:hypothetical protein